MNSDTLVGRIRDAGHRDARAIEGPGAIAPLIADLGQPGDYVVFCGAGNISAWAHALPNELARAEQGEAA